MNKLLISNFNMKIDWVTKPFRSLELKMKHWIRLPLNVMSDQDLQCCIAVIRDGNFLLNWMLMKYIFFLNEWLQYVYSKLFMSS